MVAFALSLTVLVSPAQGWGEEPVKVPVLVSWAGKMPDHAERDGTTVARLPSRAVCDAGEWRRLWAAWRPGEAVPGVNFEQAIVVVVADACTQEADQPPRGFTAVGGDLTANGCLSKAFPPCRGSYRLFLVRREGIKTVNQKPVDLKK